MTPLERLNSLPAADAEQCLLECCASPMWARAVAAQRPCADLAQLLAAADTAWQATSPAERRIALAAHPLIGDIDALRRRYDGHEHAEQGQVAGAAEATLQALATLNAAYVERHGFIFIVCATGKSAEEMLDLLRTRIGHDTAEEFATAAAEQAAITALRLRRMFGAPDG